MTRTATDILAFPYAWTDVQLKQNELAIADNLSNALEKLYLNLNYVIDATTVGSLSIAHSVNLFTAAQLQIHPEEFIDTFAVNKALFKSLYNHLIVRDNFHSRFTARYQNDGTLEVYGIRYLIESDVPLYTYSVTPANFVGINELVSTAVLNRTLYEQFTIAERLLDFCELVLDN